MPIFARSSIFYLLSLAALAPSSATLAASMETLAPHRAVYDIKLTATHSGSQVLNISGKMDYAIAPACDGWITDHHFKLFYEYADGPGMRIASDFSTFEAEDGKSMSFSSRRTRDGDMYQEIRGTATLEASGGKAVYTLPEGQDYSLSKGTLFPMAHTEELIRHAKAGDRFYTSAVFDGSDEEGPLLINVFIGKEFKDGTKRAASVDEALLNGRAWNVRMAVFPEKDREEESDYEMSLVLHENGIISDMTIDYDDFTVRQTLDLLEKKPPAACNGAPQPQNGKYVKP